MIFVIRKSVPALSALAGLAVAACASAPMSERAAAMPVFRADQPHPAVVQAMAPVKVDVCLWSENQATFVAEAADKLRARADAAGATALIDFRYSVISAAPRAPQCQRFAQAEAEPVVLRGQAHAAVDRGVAVTP